MKEEFHLQLRKKCSENGVFPFSNNTLLTSTSLILRGDGNMFHEALELSVLISSFEITLTHEDKSQIDF